MSGQEALDAALVGKAGEALVAGELLRRHIDIAYPAFDGGVDLMAYRGHDFDRVIPIQIKTRSSTCYVFQKRWFEIQNIILIQVWHAATKPEFYMFRNIQDVEGALGDRHASTSSWIVDGRYSVASPNDDQIARMQPYRDKWEWVEALFER